MGTRVRIASKYNACIFKADYFDAAKCNTG